MTEAIIQIQDLEKRFRSKNTEVYALQGINLIHQERGYFRDHRQKRRREKHAGALHQHA